MLTLYYTPTCPFCQRVLDVVEDLNIKMQLKDTSIDLVAKEEMLEKGGKSQVSFLVDDERKVVLYEAGDIVSYLEEHYLGTQRSDSFNGVRIHKSDDTCQSCQ